MKKQSAERILGRKLARELRRDELAKATGALKPISTTSMSEPPDSVVDGYEP